MPKEPKEPKDKMDKYEEEIRDILNRMDTFIPEGSKEPPKLNKFRDPAQQGQQSSGGTWSGDLRRKVYSYNSTSFMVGTIVFAISAAILGRVFPSLGMIAALLAVVCLLLAILLPIISRSYGRPEKRWRGKVVELDSYRATPSPSWRQAWWRIKRFLGFR
jgi:hypothetical protein